MKKWIWFTWLKLVEVSAIWIAYWIVRAIGLGFFYLVDEGVYVNLHQDFGSKYIVSFLLGMILILVVIVIPIFLKMLIVDSWLKSNVKWAERLSK